MLNVDMQAGNQSATEYARPTLCGWLDTGGGGAWIARCDGG
jgi:hypothetical protein